MYQFAGKESPFLILAALALFDGGTFAVKLLSIGTDSSKQTGQTQIRLLHEQSDQDLHSLLFQLDLDLLDALDTAL